MDPTPSSSRASSSSSIWPEEASPTETASSVSDVARGTPAKAPIRTRRTPTLSRLGLSRPFSSPLRRNQSQPSMNSGGTAGNASEDNSSRARVEASTSSSATIRKQRQALEARLLTLQQANKCLRDDAFTTLPLEIAKWREAGQMAAKDLWRMTGADGGDWSALGSAASQGDYGLESPPSTFSDNKRKAADSPEPSNPPILLRRPRIRSPGAEGEAAALRSGHEGADSQGAASEGSLPDLSELLRRSQSIVGVSQTPRQRQSLLAGLQPNQCEETSVPVAAPLGGMGGERRWDIGSMLDMLGADKSTLGWDVEEEDFREPDVE